MGWCLASHRYVSKKWQDATGAALEGSIDTAHFTSRI